MIRSESGKWYWTAGLVSLSIVVIILVLVRDSRHAAITLVALAVLVSAWFLLSVLPTQPVETTHYGNLLAGIFAATMGVGVWGSDWMQMLLFIAYPVVFVVSSNLLIGVVWAWVLTAAVGIGLWAGGAEVGGVLGYSLVVGAFATAMGVWISSIWSWGQERESMRLELAASQEELVAITKERATQGERERVSREVHDTLAQGYVAIIALAQTPGTRPQIESVARENLAEARALVNAWKSPSLAGGDLCDALDRLARQSGADFSGQAAVDSMEVETALFRAAQEALNNVRRHAKANKVQVSLAQTPTHFVLTVADDGVGRFPFREGDGLRGMRERAQILGGSLSISQNEGTTLTMSIPRGTQ